MILFGKKAVEVEDHALVMHNRRLRIVYVSGGQDHYDSLTQFVQENEVINCTPKALLGALDTVLARGGVQAQVKGAKSPHGDDPFLLTKDAENAMIIVGAPCGAHRFISVRDVRRVRAALKRSFAENAALDHVAGR